MIKLISFCFSLLFLLACGGEPKVDYNKMIVGKWVFVDAKRDGQDAPTLSGIEYIFNEDGTLQTNLEGAGMNGDYKYVITADTIRQSGKTEIDFVISKILEDSLFLSARISNFDFDIILEKSKE